MSREAIPSNLRRIARKVAQLPLLPAPPLQNIETSNMLTEEHTKECVETVGEIDDAGDIDNEWQYELDWGWEGEEGSEDIAQLLEEVKVLSSRVARLDSTSRHPQLKSDIEVPNVSLSDVLFSTLPTNWIDAAHHAPTSFIAGATAASALISAAYLIRK